MQQLNKKTLNDVVISGLNINPNGVYVDCTLGDGKIAEAILSNLSENGKLLVLDIDKDLLKSTTDRLGKTSFECEIISYDADFYCIDEILEDENISEIDGAILDLGVSLSQYQDSSRGFNYKTDGPLDMRYDKTEELTAEYLVNKRAKAELFFAFMDIGEENFLEFANALQKETQTNKIKTTTELTNFLKARLVGRPYKNCQIERMFSAIRHYVNYRRKDIYWTVITLTKALKKGGRLVIITRNLIEEKEVKEAIKICSQGCVCPPKTPICVCGVKPDIKKINNKPITFSAQEKTFETAGAKVRIIEKL